MEFIITWVDGSYSEETIQELAVDSKWGNIISVNGLMRKIWDKIEDRIYFWELENSDLVEVDTLGGTDVYSQGGTISKSKVSTIMSLSPSKIWVVTKNQVASPQCNTAWLSVRVAMICLGSPGIQCSAYGSFLWHH